MKRLVWLGLAVVVALGWYLRRSHPPSQVNAPHDAVAHVRTLATGERREVADRIASAQASRHVPTPAPRLPPIAIAFTSSDPDGMKRTVRGAMREVLIQLSTCYESSFASRGPKALDIVAHLTLSGDPDIGTLIDAPQLFDDKGAPLPSKLDDCLRDTLQSLELPPLEEGDYIVLDYPFKFNPVIQTDDKASDDDDDDDD
jgi:hypothetical protein